MTIIRNPEEVRHLLGEGRLLQESYYAVTGLLLTLSRFKVWKLDIENYTGWRPAIKRLNAISKRYYENMLETSKVQGKEET